MTALESVIRVIYDADNQECVVQRRKLKIIIRVSKKSTRLLLGRLLIEDIALNNSDKSN